MIRVIEEEVQLHPIIDQEEEVLVLVKKIEMKELLPNMIEKIEGLMIKKREKDQGPKIMIKKKMEIITIKKTTRLKTKLETPGIPHLDLIDLINRHKISKYF